SSGSFHYPPYTWDNSRACPSQQQEASAGGSVFRHFRAGVAKIMKANARWQAGLLAQRHKASTPLLHASTERAIELEMAELASCRTRCAKTWKRRASDQDELLSRGCQLALRPEPAPFALDLRGAVPNTRHQQVDRIDLGARARHGHRVVGRFFHELRD